MDRPRIQTLSLLCITLLIAGCATGSSYIDDDYDKAEKAFDRGRYQEAAQYYQKFIGDNPQSNLNDVALYYLAESYEKSGQIEKAQETLNTLIDKYNKGFWVDSANRKLQELKQTSE